jgi:hypothetical protein
MAEPCPPMPVKGKSQPLEVYDVKGLKGQ